MRGVRKEVRKDLTNACEGRNVCKECTLKTDEGGAHRKKEREEGEVGRKMKEDDGRKYQRKKDRK